MLAPPKDENIPDSEVGPRRSFDERLGRSLNVKYDRFDEEQARQFAQAKRLRDKDGKLIPLTRRGTSWMGESTAVYFFWLRWTLILFILISLPLFRNAGEYLSQQGGAPFLSAFSASNHYDFCNFAPTCERCLLDLPYGEDEFGFEERESPRCLETPNNWYDCYSFGANEPWIHDLAGYDDLPRRRLAPELETTTGSFRIRYVCAWCVSPTEGSPNCQAFDMAASGADEETPPFYGYRGWVHPWQCEDDSEILVNEINRGQTVYGDQCDPDITDPIVDCRDPDFEPAYMYYHAENFPNGNLEADCVAIAPASSFQAPKRLSFLFLVMVMLAFLIWGCSLPIYQRRRRKRLMEGKQKNVTVGMYSMYVTAIPDCTEAELKAHFSEYGPVANVALFRRKLRLATELERQRKTLEEAEQVRLDGKEQSEKLKAKLREHEAAIEEARKESARAIAAFVTMELEADRHRAWKAHNMNGLCSCCMDQRLSFKGKKITVAAAPDPSDIIWTSLHVNGFKRWFFRMRVYTSTSFLLGVALIVLFTTFAGGESIGGLGQSGALALINTSMESAVLQMSETLREHTTSSRQGIVFVLITLAPLLNSTLTLLLLFPSPYDGAWWQRISDLVYNLVITYSLLGIAWRVTGLTGIFVREFRKWRAKTQAAFNRAYAKQYLDFDLAKRYANAVKICSISLVFVSGMPLLFPMTAFVMLVAYFADKYCIIRVYAAPPQSRDRISGTAQYFFYIMLLVAVFVNASSLLAPGDGVYGPSTRTGIPLIRLIQGDTSGAIDILLSLSSGIAVFLAYWVVLKFCCRPCYRCCCGCCKTKKGGKNSDGFEGFIFTKNQPFSKSGLRPYIAPTDEAMATAMSTVAEGFNPYSFSTSMAGGDNVPGTGAGDAPPSYDQFLQRQVSMASGMLPVFELEDYPLGDPSAPPSDYPLAPANDGLPPPSWAIAAPDGSPAPIPVEQAKTDFPKEDKPMELAAPATSHSSGKRRAPHTQRRGRGGGSRSRSRSRDGRGAGRSAGRRGGRGGRGGRGPSRSPGRK